jgi:hypothetical protein
MNLRMRESNERHEMRGRHCGGEALVFGTVDDFPELIRAMKKG